MPRHEPITEEDLNEHKNESFLLGQVVGLEDAAGILMKEASSYFVRGQDEKAELVRDLSKKLTEAQKARRLEFDKKYHPDFLKK